jgi:hypothetical protein
MRQSQTLSLLTIQPGVRLNASDSESKIRCLVQLVENLCLIAKVLSGDERVTFVILDFPLITLQAVHEPHQLELTSNTESDRKHGT